MLLRASYTSFLNTSKGGDSTTLLRSLFCTTFKLYGNHNSDLRVKWEFLQWQDLCRVNRTQRPLYAKVLDALLQGMYNELSLTVVSSYGGFMF